MSQRSRTRLAREARREQILDAATIVFADREPTEVTFEEIADAAGVSRALVYNYFGDRNGLLSEVYRRHVELLRERVAASLASCHGLQEAITKVIRAHFEYAAENPRGYRYVVGEGGAARHPAVARSRLAAVESVLGDSPEGRIAGHALLATVEAGVMSWLSRRDVPFERAVEMVTVVVWSGFAGLGAIEVAPRPAWSGLVARDLPA